MLHKEVAPHHHLIWKWHLKRAVRGGATPKIGCPNKVFLQCALRFKRTASNDFVNITMGRNLLKTLLLIDSPYKLRRSCLAYTDVLPCFRQKLHSCGSELQWQLFSQVDRALHFFCPNSINKIERRELNSRKLLKYRGCLATVLSSGQPIHTQTVEENPNKSFAPTCSSNEKVALKNETVGEEQREKLVKCTEQCASNNYTFVCRLKLWLSQQNLCTLTKIEEKCGPEASIFYTSLQQYIFEPNFPFICLAHLDTTAMNPISTEPRKIPIKKVSVAEAECCLVSPTTHIHCNSPHTIASQGIPVCAAETICQPKLCSFAPPTSQQPVFDATNLSDQLLRPSQLESASFFEVDHSTPSWNLSDFGILNKLLQWSNSTRSTPVWHIPHYRH
uniref:Uncharacterized protein n=1 Tax=Ditylenchus dipsaci TaxID=166011 RepID=A0A915D057_9BILA